MNPQKILLHLVQIFALSILLGCSLDATLYDGTLPLLGPKVQFTPPMTAQSYKGGQRVDFQWKLNDPSLKNQPLYIETSFDEGITWAIAQQPLLSASVSFLDLPQLSTNKLKFRLRYEDMGSSVILFESPTILIDSSAPQVTLLTFNAGGIYAGGSLQTISWTADDQSFGHQPVTIYYSQDKISWTPIQGPQASSASLNWTMPTLDAAQVWLKVYAEDTHGFSTEAISEIPFTIDSQSPALAIQEPKLGDIWNPLSNNDILYQAADSHLKSGSLTVEISTDAGVTYTKLKSNQDVNNKHRLTPADLTLIPNSNAVRIRLSVQDEANHVTSVETATFTFLRAIPQLTLEQAGSNFSNQNTFTFTGKCDLTGDMANTDVTITGPMITDTVSCTGTAPSGSWSYTTPSFSTDDVRLFQFSQTNTFGATTTKTTTWVRDTVLPMLSALSINSGAATTITPFVKVTAIAADNNGYPLKVSISEAATGLSNCSSAGAIVFSQTQATMQHSFNLSMTDGTKKLCAWAEDAAGNISTMILPTGDLTINSATISYEAGSPPVILELSAVNPQNSSTTFAAGAPVNISWKITDSEGLSSSPVTLEYTTDGTIWKSIVKDFGSLANGTTLYEGSYTSFAAPTDAFFMLRLIATDTSGNRSLRVTSNTMNTGNWSIFAGNPDNGVGGSSKAVSLPLAGSPTSQSLAIHPHTGEIFIRTENGIVSVNPINATSKMIASYKNTLNYAETGLSENGGSFTQITINPYIVAMNFDSAGRLYINFGDKSLLTQTKRIYQIDLVNRTSRLYAGGGSSVNPTSALEAYLEYTPMAFDEENSLYFAVPCVSNYYPETKRRLYKLTQLPDGQPGALSLVAGNCTAVPPANNTSALSTSFAYGSNWNYGSLVVKNLGNTIYYNNYSASTYKIINGIHYNTAIPGVASFIRTLAFDKKENALYAIMNNTTYGFVHKFNSIGLPQSGGETQDGITIPLGPNSPTCLNDNIPASSSCIYSEAMALNKNNTLLFLDGVKVNAGGSVRLRYIDGSQKVQTLAGTLPFFGNGLNKAVMRSPNGLAGIYYKSTTEPGSVWTPGLYFGDYVSLVFGRINPNNNVQILWGNQATGDTNIIPDNTQVSDSLSMGQRYTINGGIFTFDSTGLPWLRISNRILSLDATARIQNRQTGPLNGSWNQAPVGSSPAATAIYPYGFYQNFTMKKDRYVFLMGGYFGLSSFNLATDAPAIRIFDFVGNTIKHVIGGSGGPVPAPDSLSSSDDLSASNLSSVCSLMKCSVQFVENDPNIETDDELYFSEGLTIRRLTNPLNPGSQKLETILTVPSIPFADPTNTHNTPSNIFVTPDRSRMFYIVESGLYCHKLTPGASSWCNNSNLGFPTALGSLPARPNQFTMKDATTLLLNTGKIIVQFKLPAD